MKRGNNYKIGTTFGLIPMHLHPDASINKVLITGNEKENIEYFKDQVITQQLEFGAGLLVYGMQGVTNTGLRLDALFKAAGRTGQVERFKQSEAVQAAPAIYAKMCAHAVVFIEPDEASADLDADRLLGDFAQALHASMTQQDSEVSSTPMMEQNPQPFMTFLPVTHSFFGNEWTVKFLHAFRQQEHSLWLDLVSGVKEDDEKLLTKAANLVSTCIMFRQPLTTQAYAPQYRPKDLLPLQKTVFCVLTDEILAKVRMPKFKEWDFEMLAGNADRGYATIEG